MIFSKTTECGFWLPAKVERSALQVDSLKSDRSQLIAISGLQSPNGTVKNPLIQFLTGGSNRLYDSEAKILEDIASRIVTSGVQADANGKYSSVMGKIQLFTERMPCGECAPLILTKWKELFPNVKITEVLHGPRFLAPGRLSDFDDIDNFTSTLK